MSINVMTRVWNRSRSTGAQLLLVLALADHCNDDGICWPGVNHLAQKTRMSERSVQRMIKKAENDGEVYVIRDNGRDRTNQYFVVVGLDPDQIIEVLTKRLHINRSEASQVALEISIKGDKVVTDIGTKKGDKPGKRVTIRARKGDRAMSPEPSINPHYEPSEEPSREGGASRTAMEPFWEAMSIKEIGLVPEISLFRKITGRFPGQPQYSLIWSTLCDHPEWDFKYLHPYWIEWAAVRAYNQSALGWLLEWADAGVIPPRGPKQNGNNRGTTPLERSLQALKEFGEENGE